MARSAAPPPGDKPGAVVRCRVCGETRKVTVWVPAWECEACLAGERPDPARAGVCAECRAIRPAVWPTRWGDLCLQHLAEACRRAVNPEGWP